MEVPIILLEFEHTLNGSTKFSMEVPSRNVNVSDEHSLLVIDFSDLHRCAERIIRIMWIHFEDEKQ